MLFQPSGIPVPHHRARALINQAEKLSLSVGSLLDEAADLSHANVPMWQLLLQPKTSLKRVVTLFLGI